MKGIPMFTINNVKTFKDSVHGYVEIPKCFVETLMDNDYFQRLRNVEQTGMRVLYPNSKHDRFSHSLGVFYLGNRAVDALLDNFSKDQYWELDSDNQSILYWAKNKVLFLIACLLHDIGHAPFSHALEYQLLSNSKATVMQNKKKRIAIDSMNGCYVTNELQRIISCKENEYMKFKYNEVDYEAKIDVSRAAPHEQIGALLILNEFFKKRIISIFDRLNCEGYPCLEDEKIIIDRIDETDDNSKVVMWDDLCFIARMIMGIKYDDWHPERQIRNCFIELLNGDNFDVDKLDYIVRDTHMSGINNISLDVDRLLSSLCIVTKTKHMNKFELDDKTLDQITIISIENVNTNNKISIDGSFYGTIIIHKGTEVLIRKESKIESLTNIALGEAKIHYKNARRAEFDQNTRITQDSEVVQPDESGNDDKTKVVLLLGKDGKRPFYTSIRDATLLTDFHFIADEEVRLRIHNNCKIDISGLFHSDGSIRLFNINKLRGDISEVELLADTFKYDFTRTKVPGENGYNTFTIGFKKQAINVIANVMDARNYLYLWIYAHHKVIYYANFLIPVLVRELSPKTTTENFPDLSLDFNNIRYLDDAYIWTVIRYQCCKKSWKKNEKDTELKVLLDELFTRNYKKSLYKSLAEFDLFFEKYDLNTKNKLQEYINTCLITTGKNSKPYIELGSQNKRNFSVGYFKKSQINDINIKLQDIIKDSFSKQESIPDEYTNLKVTELVYVSVDYKRKQLQTFKTFIDMNDDVIPVSQIPLLESQTNKTIPSSTNKYFYLYYQTNYASHKEIDEAQFVKKAIKIYFDCLVEKNINK